MQNYMTIIINAIKSWVNGKINKLEKDLNSKVEEVSEQASNAIDAINEIPQADWNQSDETAKDYVKNRTHYDDSKTFFNLEDYNGDYSSLESVETEGPAHYAEGVTYYKVSEVDGIDLSCSFDIEFFVNNIEKDKVNNLKPNENFTQSFPALTYGIQREDYPCGTSMLLSVIRSASHVNTSLIIALEDGSSFNVEGTEVTLPKGIWVRNINVRPVFTSLTVNDLKQLDQKYTPNADWSQSDPNGEGYIKNRTHYEEENLIDIAGLEYEIEINKDTAFYKFSLPLELGQKWNIWYDSMDGNGEIILRHENLEVQVTPDDELGIYSSESNPLPFDLLGKNLFFDNTFLNMIKPTIFKVVGVSGYITGDPIVHKIDQKYVPNADWSQSNPNDEGYIKNRTHYDDIVYTLKDKNEISDFLRDLGYDPQLFQEDVTSPKPIEGLTFRVVIDGQVYDEVPVYTGCYYAGGYTYGIGDYCRSSNWPAGTNYGFCCTAYGCVPNPDFFPNGIESIEVYAVEKDFKYLDSKFIKDMYHEEFKEIFNVKDAEFSYGEYLPESPFVLTEGNTYIVNWDGVESVCEAITFEPGVIGFYDSSLHFEIFYIGPIESCGIRSYGNNDGESSTHTISIKEKVIHTIQPKYIKDMYYDTGKTITELVPLQIVSEFTLMEEPIYVVENPFELKLIEGATYIVNWDGIEYELTCEVFLGTPYIGNFNLLNMQPGGDVPFRIAANEAEGMVMVATESTEESHEIGIIEIKHDMKQLDIKYLPILEEEIETVFEIEGFTGGEILDESYKMLVGKYRVTVDGKSEIAEFFEDLGYSHYYNDNFEIETWNGGISFWFSEDKEHSIKIEKIKKVIKEEHLPKSITTAPDWNQNDVNAPDYIENRTHYTEEKIIVLSEKLELFDENGDSNGFVMTNYEWDQNKEYIVLCNGTKYPVTWDRFYYAGSYCYYLGARPNNLTHDLPFSLFGYNMSEIDARPLDIATYDSIEKYDIKVVNVEDDIHYLDSKYIKDMYYSSNKYIGTLNFIATSSNTMEYTYTEADVDIFNSFMTSRGNGEIIEVNIDNEACLMSVAFDRGWFRFAGGISGEMNYNDGQVWSATINATNIVLTTGNTYKIKFYNTQEEEIKYIDPKYIKDMYYDEIIDTKSATVECTSESPAGGSFKDAHYYKEIYYFFRPFLYDYSGKLRITWNGKVYHFDFDKNETVYIGDTNFEEYPFAIDWGREWGVVYVPTSGTYNFEITKVNFKQLDEKFIPDTIARVGTPQPYFVLTDTVTGAPYKIEITNGNLVSSPLEEV